MEAINNNWSGTVEFKKIFVPTGELKLNGEPKLRPMTTRKILLFNCVTKVELAFTVTKTSCGWSLRDPRGDSAGDRVTWNAGTQVAGRKDWKGKSLTPTGFVKEVERLIGTDRAHALLVEATFGVKPAE